MGSKVDAKVVLLGKEYSGKTSLVERYLHHRFNDSVPYQNVSKLVITLMLKEKFNNLFYICYLIVSKKNVSLQNIRDRSAVSKATCNSY